MERQLRSNPPRLAEPVGNPPMHNTDDVAAPPGAIDEAPFQGGRGLCGRSERTAPDLDQNTYAARQASSPTTVQTTPRCHLPAT